jgi:hypothetical protein
MKKAVIIVLFAALAGCTGNRKLQTLKRDIERQQQELRAMLKPIEELNRKREAKWLSGALDEHTDSITLKYIQQLKDSIASRLQRFDALYDTKNLHNNKKEAIAYLNKVKSSYKKELENVLFLDDLFDASTFSRLNTAAFFSSGEYFLSDTTYQKAGLIMNQIVQDACRFSVRYPSRKLKALFVVTGYADEEAIAPGTELFKSLANSVGANDAIKRKQLNAELSTRRATFIKDVLTREFYIYNKANPTPNLSASFIALGKGEELPRGLIRDYQPIDERRRVVLLYWSILPEL